MRARVALFLLGLWLNSSEILAVEAVAKATRGGLNPLQCFQAVHDARAVGDYRRLVDYLTEANACCMAGQVAFELDQLVFLRMPQAEQARDLLQQHGLEGCDIRGIHSASSRRDDPTQALVRIGAWVEDPATFLAAGNALLDAVRQEAPRVLERELERSRRMFAEQLAAATSESERQQILKDQEATLALQQAAEEASQQCQAAEEYRQSLANAELHNIKITGDFAQGTVVAGKHNSTACFRRIDQRWLLATGRNEPKIGRPSAAERSLARLASLGRHDFEPGNQRKIVAFRYNGEEVEGRLTDRDLDVLAQHTSVREVELTRAAEVTDVGLAALARSPQLERVKLCAVPATMRGLEALAGAKQLKHLELMNLDLSDAAVAALREGLPECTIQERYCLTPAVWNGGFQRQRDRSRFAIFIAAAGLERLTGSDASLKISSLPALDKPATPDEYPQLKSLARAVTRLQVQVFSESPLDHLGDAWWKENPWFERGQLPQYAIFAPGSDVPVVLAGDVTAEKLGVALIELVRKTRQK